MLGYQYLLLLVFAISLVTMQTAFAQQSPEDCGPDQVFQLGRCQDILEPTPTITVSTDKSSYKAGDIVRISGNVEEVSSGPVPITILITGPDGNIVAVHQITPDSSGVFLTLLDTAEVSMKLSGVYKINAQYGVQKSTTIFKFTSSQQPSDCGPNQVFQLGRCQDIEKTGPQAFTIDTDQPSYDDGDKIRITGNVGTLSESFPNTLVTIIITGPTNNIIGIVQITPDASGQFSHNFIAGEAMNITGEYTISAKYGTQTSTTTFSFSAITILDTIPPKILQPKDIVVDASDSNGAIVTYEVLAIDNEDEIIKPSCSPSSGSFFPIGDTTVVCSAFDSSGNAAPQKSFLVTVNAPLIIPDWIKDVAAFWCDDKIDDASFIEGIQYLIDNDVIVVPETQAGMGGTQVIPSWIKNNACWWSQGLISNSDFAQGIQWLIGQGIIRV